MEFCIDNSSWTSTSKSGLSGKERELIKKKLAARAKSVGLLDKRRKDATFYHEKGGVDKNGDYVFMLVK